MHRFSRPVAASVALVLSQWSVSSDLTSCDPALKPIVQTAPLYPLLESSVLFEGRVVVEFTITENGDTVDIEVVESVSKPRSSRFEKGFGNSAVAALASWKYAQTEASCRLRQTLIFLLEG